MANNKIVYGDQTLIDLTSDTVTPETLAMGETAHSASGAQIVGTMSPSGPTTILTPSNSSPPAIVDGTAYTADGDGYAIKSFNTKTPSSTPVSVSSGEIDKMGGNGYLINSYANITPSKDGTYFGSGMNKMSVSGYAYTAKPTLKTDTLWTNPNPATAYDGNNPITLNKSITDYLLIGIEWRKTNAKDDRIITIVPAEVPPSSSGATSANTSRMRGAVGEFYTPSGGNLVYRFRSFTIVNNTQIDMNRALQSSGGSSSSTDTPGYLTPIRVLGYYIG